MLLKATNIHKRYATLEVLKGVDIEIKKAEVVSIVGASGAGKSTLLHILGTLDSADSGELEICDTNLRSLDSKKMARFRNNKLGFIFQFHHLLPEFTALENVCIPAFIGKQNEAQSRKRAAELLDFLGLSHRLEHKPSELSGGEQQRVAVARSLINSPEIVFADEPSGNLDSASAKNLHELFFKLRDTYGQAFIIVTHNEDLAVMADRRLVMQDGRFVADQAS